MSEDNEAYRWWLAINQGACAMSPYALPEPTVTPTPQMLIGFRTAEEARVLLKVCLDAPVPEVRRELNKVMERTDVVVVRPENPQPPSPETLWSVGPKAMVG